MSLCIAHYDGLIMSVCSKWGNGVSSTFRSQVICAQRCISFPIHVKV